MAYKLFAKCPKPSSIDKTNVMQADFLFHDITIAAMKLQKSQLVQTQQISWPRICTFWNVVNVKTPLLGIKKERRYQETNHWIRLWCTFVPGNVFRLATRLERKTRSKSMKQFRLSSETFLSTIQTCNALRSLACKLINEEGFSYVMLGQFHWKSALVCNDTSEEQITVSQSDKYWRQKNW